MTDVARLAGVSHQTVSRVLNGHTSVRPETRARVLAAIEQLGYRRNLSARALVTRRSGLIGIVSSGSSRSGPAGTLGALEQAARSAGYFVTVAIAPEPDPATHTEIAGAFVEQGVEGVVVIAPTPEVAEVAEALSSQVPVLVVSAWNPPDDVATISVDQRAGAQLAAEHLIGLGHTDVVHVAGPVDWFDAAARIDGWHAALAAADITPRPDLVGDWSSERGYELGRELLRDLPSAVFAANDLTALGVLRAFAEAGVRVPSDVSVIGFDDVEGAASYYPPLTTVRQDLRALGAAALGSLVEVIAGGSALPRRLPTELVERASTAVPRAPRPGPVPPATDEHGRPEPPRAGAELDTLVGFLEFLRATLALKTSDLGDEALRTRLPPSSMTLGGMLHHLAYVEDNWFGIRLSGLSPAPPWDTVDWDQDSDWDWHAADHLDGETVRDCWRAAVERSRALLADVLADGGPNTLERHPRARVNVRFVLTHMIEEYARHAGHADLIRESLDGLTGE